MNNRLQTVSALILRGARVASPPMSFAGTIVVAMVVTAVMAALVNIAAVVAPIGTAHARTSAADGTLLETRAYAFPAYEDARGYTRVDGSTDAITKYWTRTQYENAVNDPAYRFEKLIYASDRLEVVTYVYRPNADGRFPTIVFNRGSGVHGDIAPVLVPLMQRYAKAGYVVLAPMYRESDGGEGDDANGGDDIHDLMNIVPLVEQLVYVDKENLYLAGESRGAMMTFLAMKDGFPARAASVWGGFTDLDDMIRRFPAIAQYASREWPGFNLKNPQRDIERRSAIYWPDALTTPLLLMHGGNDRSVPPSHTLNLAKQLDELGYVYGVTVFAEDDHVLTENQLRRDADTIDWFRRFSTSAHGDMMDELRGVATERDIVRYGYRLLQRRQVPDAIEAFRLAVELFPQSSNAHDSLAEGLAVWGDTDGAIAEYRIALDLVTTDDERGRIRETIERLEQTR